MDASGTCVHIDFLHSCIVKMNASALPTLFLCAWNNSGIYWYHIFYLGEAPESIGMRSFLPIQRAPGIVQDLGMLGSQNTSASRENQDNTELRRIL